MCVLLSDEFSISVVMTGVLSVGLGIVHYTQESVPSQVLHDLSVYLISLFLSLSHPVQTNGVRGKVDPVATSCNRG